MTTSQSMISSGILVALLAKTVQQLWTTHDDTAGVVICCESPCGLRAEKSRNGLEQNVRPLSSCFLGRVIQRYLDTTYTCCQGIFQLTPGGRQRFAPSATEWPCGARRGKAS